ncbi:MAG: NAD(P)/FAD-dependent oxidoreductase [Spirochaetales bacterium]|nr:NAD(P)/FAD-dependent oxidoreductase [Spirochaetales bacterium]
MKVVIIGNHAAGLTAAETLKKLDQSCSVLVISKEDVPPYSRCLVADLIPGKKKIEDILFKDEDFYRKNKIDTLFGREALSVQPDKNQIVLDTKQTISYDHLILATGATPVMPESETRQGVFGLRTIEDAAAIKKYVKDKTKAVVLGGGLVGIKAALALRQAGKEVCVLVGSNSILSQIIGCEEAEIAEAYLKRVGIDFLKQRSLKAIVGKDKVKAVLTEQGETVECGLVISAKGVAPRKKLAEAAGIECEYGILIDDRCRTNIENIYAAGDTAQSRDTLRKAAWLNSIWPLAVEEGRVAAENILGRDSVLRQRTSMNSLVLGELSLISCGLSGLRDENEQMEKIIITDSPHTGTQHMKKFLFKDNRLVAFSLIGDISHAGVLNLLLRKEIDISAIKRKIISGRYDFATVLPVLLEDRGKFTEPEFINVFDSLVKVT